MAPHSSTLAWKIPWTEEPSRLQSMGSLRVGHDWATSLSLFTFMHWRRKWQPTPVFLPGESHGQRSLVGYSPQSCKELDTTERLSTHTRGLFCIDSNNHIDRFVRLWSPVKFKFHVSSRWLCPQYCLGILICLLTGAKAVPACSWQKHLSPRQQPVLRVPPHASHCSLCPSLRMRRQRLSAAG